ncbi:MAG: glycosyltransferase [Candidatus Hodarchaeota archaeon]
MKKLLMISYHFPPSIINGGERVFKFAKYLPLYHVEPHIITIKEKYISEKYIRKETLLKVKIYRTIYLDCTMIYNIYAKLKAIRDYYKKKRKNRNPISYIIDKDDVSMYYRTSGSNKFFAWFLIPDIHIGWLPFALMRSIKVIKKKKIRTAFTTSGPFTSHLVGGFLKCFYNIRWIADFRDPYTNNANLYVPTSLHKRIHKCIEKNIIKRADVIISNTNEWNRRLKEIYPEFSNKMYTIPNGFDPSDYVFQNIPKDNNGKIKLMFVGHLYASRTPLPLFQALRQMKSYLRLDKLVSVEFVGKNNLTNMIKDFHLDDIVVDKGYLVKEKVLKLLSQADIAILIGGKGIDNGSMPSKIFDYFAYRKPILAIFPKGPVTEMIKKYNIGWVCEPENTEEISNVITEIISKKNFVVNYDENYFKQFERKEVTRLLARFI